MKAPDHLGCSGRSRSPLECRVRGELAGLPPVGVQGDTVERNVNSVHVSDAGVPGPIVSPGKGMPHQPLTPNTLPGNCLDET